MVADAIRERIQTEHYGAGAWLPPERELAEEFRVGRPVVRAAISSLIATGHLTRSPGCRPLISYASSCQPADRRRARAALRMIALVLPHQPSYASAQAILRGVNRGLAEHDRPYHVAVFDTHAPDAPEVASGSATEREVLARLSDEGAAGVIIWHLSGDHTLPAILRLHASGSPVVFLDRCPRGHDCDYVGVDNRAGVQMAVEHLIGLGHRRIAYLTNSEQISTVRDRELGYRDALMGAGIAPDPALVYVTPELLRADLSGAAEYIVGLPDRPTAAVVLNDLHAFELIRQLEARGVRVPADMSVIGFDDVEANSPHPGMLTTVRQSFEEIGRRAADLLLRRLRSPEGAPETYQHVVLPTALTVRRTTDRPSNPPAARAE